MRTPLAFMLIALTVAFAADQPVKLTLVSKDGKSIETEVVSVGDTSAKIKKADGMEFEIPFDRLKPESVTALKKAAAAPAPAPPANDRPLPKGRPAKPADIPEKVVVFLGEKVFVKFTETATGLTKPVIVDNEPEVTVPHLSLDLQKRKEGDKVTTGVVTNYFEKTIRVKCLARNKDKDTYYTVSIQPLFKGMFAGESWAADVEELVFYDFTWSDEVNPAK